MKMKKIIAGIAASALAVSAMATSAFAAGKVTSSLKNSADDGSGNFQVYLMIDGTNLYDADLEKIASLEVTLSNNATEEGWVGGALITQCDAASWNEIGQYTSNSEADDPGKKFYDVKLGDASTLTFDVDGFAADSTYVIITVQSYAAEGIEVNVDNVVAKDASGNVIVDVANGAGAPPADDNPATDENPATTTPAGGDTEKPSDDKNSPNTGVEGVAVVAGLAVLAAGAVVVAKKRK